MSILSEAHQIVHERSEEKQRQYGDFHESMRIMRDIFNAMTGHDLSVQDMYVAMIALKFSRQRHAHKRDNMLDAVAYISSMTEYIETEEEYHLMQMHDRAEAEQTSDE